MDIDWKKAKRPTGCVLLIIAINFAIFGVVFISCAILGWDWRSLAPNLSKTPETNVARITEVILGSVSFLIAWISLRLALRPDPKYQELGLTSFEKREIHKRESRLSPHHLKLIEEIRERLRNAPSQDEVICILKDQNQHSIKFANPALEPIAFAIRQQPRSRYWKGWGYEIVAWTGAILSIAALLYLVIVHPHPLTLLLALFGVRGIVYILLRFIHRARRYRLKPHKTLEKDARAPILYLRAFSDDFAESFEGYSAATAEERLVSGFAHYGPPIAVGSPKEDLPLPGAIRIYFEGEKTNWAAGVLYLMLVSQLVVIQAGFAEGLLWEIGMARKRLDPHKLVISFHGWNEMEESSRCSQYLRFKSLAEELLWSKLPDELIRCEYLSFNDNWEASWTESAVSLLSATGSA